MAMTSGDFDGDGDLDLIVGAYSFNSGGRLYLFENDGGGILQREDKDKLLKFFC